MDKQELLDYWRRFFADLFVGTIVNLFLWGFVGLGLGWACLLSFKGAVLGELDWKPWVEATILIFGLFWYGGFGALLGLVFSVLTTAGKKFSEAVNGLQGLLDLFSREAIGKFSRSSKTIPRDDVARQFDNIGKNFQKKLRLKKGILGSVSRLMFGMILKALKFFFLDEVVEELQKSPANEIRSSDIEHAVRRVGVGMILSPITDNIVLLQILIGVVMALTFGVPFALLWFD